MVNDEANQNPGLDRRAVLVGAAWSVPVIALAAATPVAAATSQVGQLAIESVGGGTWVDELSEYYGITVQLRNNADFATVAPITSVTLMVTVAAADVSAPPELAIIANQGGGSPTVNLPDTDPLWTSDSAGDDGNGNVTYVLTYIGSIAAQTGVCNVSFGIRGPASGLISPLSGIISGSGTPSDGVDPVRSGVIY